jgi:mutual gliding-motility protein MglA
MVFFNYATMQMAAKIVYYGPGLCGKTTNLHHIYSKTSPQSRGEMVSLETETDRTLFFDLLPIDVGLIGGFKTRLQLYTVPGQVFYNTTRKLVLKGADGIVFVADSQRAMLDANAESLRNLRENITEIGIDFDELPLVLQLNKRDLPNVATREELLEQLDPSGRYAHVESSAVNGDGVFETLKLISKLTLRSIRRRMMGDEVQKPAPPSQPVFTVTAAPSEPPRAPALVPPVPAAEDDAGVPRPFPLRVATEAPASAPPPQEHPRVEPPLPPPSAAPPSPEPEIVFSENAKAAAPAAGEMKHVKVRSTIDIMAELESLRKKATQTTPREKKAIDVDALIRPRRDSYKNYSVRPASAAAKKSRSVRITINFEDEAGNVVQTDETSYSINRSELNALLVNLKIDLGSA